VSEIPISEMILPEHAAAMTEFHQRMSKSWMSLRTHHISEPDIKAIIDDVFNAGFILCAVEHDRYMIGLPPLMPTRGTHSGGSINVMT
jgi:hypothetical protein